MTSLKESVENAALNRYAVDVGQELMNHMATIWHKNLCAVMNLPFEF
eukprot:CAMPEP_0201285956 /NCGR_PEP_ID=MMETSP1317-20130820/114073_1 /ASSEMBLY_ACC=CAM_ASM_000770 /TAXON_ID=187299 /ORGANISM="Undescribed Undescribed, Strain Undescribed" /LENGTH=46 /DNA_ID= /DNA_START= /DNA_END= /DNA_ORIENTATION=